MSLKSITRIHSILKWITLSQFAVIALMWILSLWWTIDYANHSRNPALDLSISSGHFHLRSVTRAAAWRYLSFDDIVPRLIASRIDGWDFQRSIHDPSLGMLFGRWYYGDGPGFLILQIPLWMPLLALAIPTAILWYWSFGRVRTGACVSCGYNLTGNVSGICPECGTEIAGVKS